MMRIPGIVLDGETSESVLVVTPKLGQECHNITTVLEGDGAELDGLEKLRCGHCQAGECIRSLLMAVGPI